MAKVLITYVPYMFKMHLTLGEWRCGDVMQHACQSEMYIHIFPSDSMRLSAILMCTPPCRCTSNTFTFTSLSNTALSPIQRVKFHYTHQHCYYVKSYTAFVIVGALAVAVDKLNYVCTLGMCQAHAAAARNDFDTHTHGARRVYIN